MLAPIFHYKFKNIFICATTDFRQRSINGFIEKSNTPFSFQGTNDPIRETTTFFDIYLYFKINRLFVSLCQRKMIF